MVSQRASALRFFHVRTLKRNYMLERRPFPRLPDKLPTLISRDEVSQLLAPPANRLHRTKLMTMCSPGIRPELCTVAISDIDSQPMVIHVHRGKGGRYRDVPLSVALLEGLRGYCRRMKPKAFLFSGPSRWLTSRCANHRKNGLVRMSEQAQAAGVEKHISPNTLHYSYATHMLEARLYCVTEHCRHGTKNVAQIDLGRMRNSQVLSRSLIEAGSNRGRMG